MPSNDAAIPELGLYQGLSLFSALVISSLLGLSMIVMLALRVASRLCQRKALEPNDFGEILAAICTIGLAILGLLAVAQVEGRPFSPARRDRALLYASIGQVLWAAAVTASKLSMLHFIMKIFPGRRTRHCCWILAILSGLLFVGVFIMLFTLPPIYLFKHSTVFYTILENKVPSGFVYPGIASVALNGLICVVPMEELLQKKIETLKKVKVLGIFGLGFLTCLVASCRLAFIEYDVTTYRFVLSAFLAQAEPALNICFGCVPIVFPALREMFQPMLPVYHVVQRQIPFKQYGRRLGAVVGSGIRKFLALVQRILIRLAMKAKVLAVHMGSLFGKSPKKPEPESILLRELKRRREKFPSQTITACSYVLPSGVPVEGGVRVTRTFSIITDARLPYTVVSVDSVRMLLS